MRKKKSVFSKWLVTAIICAIFLFTTKTDAFLSRAVPLSDLGEGEHETVDYPVMKMTAYTDEREGKNITDSGETRTINLDNGFIRALMIALLGFLVLAVPLERRLKAVNRSSGFPIRRGKPQGFSGAMDCKLFIYEDRTDRITVDENISIGYGFDCTTHLGDFFVRLRSVHPECDVDRIQRAVKRAISNSRTQVLEFPIEMGGESMHWIKLMLMPYSLNEHKTTHIFGSITDVTASHEAFRKNAEMLSRMPGGFHRCYLSEPFHSEYISAGLFKMMGYNPEDCMTSPTENRYIQAIHEEDRVLYVKFITSLSEKPSINSCEYRLVRKDGSIITVSDTMESIRATTGKMYGYSAILDITARVHELAETKDLLKQGFERESLLLKEQTELLTAVKTAYDMIVSVNLTQNTYHIIDNKNHIIKLEQIGTIDEFVDQNMRFIPDSAHAIAYRKLFCRNHLLEAYDTGKKQVLLRHTQVGKNNTVHWVDTMVVFVAPQEHNKDVIGITLAKVVDGDQRRNERMQQLLQKEAVLHEGLMENCSVFAEVNLSTGYLIGDVLDYTKENGPLVFSFPAELDAPVHFDVLARWWAEHKIVSDQEAFLRQCNCDYLLSLYDSGQRYVEIYCQKWNSSNEVRTWKLMFFLNRNEMTGDITATCVVDDVTEKEENKKRIKQLTDELQDSRIKSSMGQMQPHFLYNTLGSIREIILSDPQYASDLIYDFSTHLRACIHVMSNGGNNLIPFSKEMENVQAFVNIEKMRFGERLRVEYDIGSDDFEIAPLSIQPLVENAIRHGIQLKGRQGGTVSISTRTSGNAYIITVKDDGVGFDYNAIHESVIRGERDSTGLENLVFRLEKMLSANVQIESQPGRGTEIVIAIPKECA